MTTVQPPEFQRRLDNFVPNSKRYIFDKTVRAAIASIVGIKDDEDDWVVNNSLGDSVYMISPNKKKLPANANLKGLAVDIKARCLVLQSFPCTAMAIADQLVPNERGLICLKDNYGVTHEFVADDLHCVPALEGAIVNVTYHNGRMIFASGSTFDATKTQRLSSQTLGEIYHQAGGPSPGTLFDLRKKYSPFVYCFGITGPYWTTASRLECAKGAVFLFGVFQNWKVDEPPYPADQCETVPRFGFDHHSVITGIPGHLDLGAEDGDFILEEEDAYPATVYTMPALTLEQANRFLRYGYSGEKAARSSVSGVLLPGESLILTDKTGKRLQVSSPAYAWRRAIRGETGLAAEFYARASDVWLTQDEFNAKYPSFGAVDFEELEQFINAGNYLDHWPESKLQLPRTTVADRLRIIEAAFLMAATPEQQAEALGLADKFVEDQFKVKETIVGLHGAIKVPDNIFSIIRSARNLAGISGSGQAIAELFEKKPELKTLYEQKVEEMLVRMVPGSEIYSMSKYFRRQEYKATHAE